MSGATAHEGEGLVVYRVDGSTPFIAEPVGMNPDQSPESESSMQMDLIWVSDGYRHGDQDGIGWPQTESDAVLAH
jgi:hypothetical protein